MNFENSVKINKLIDQYDDRPPATRLELHSSMMQNLNTPSPNVNSSTGKKYSYQNSQQSNLVGTIHNKY